jgi:hypothetical protein
MILVFFTSDIIEELKMGKLCNWPMAKLTAILTEEYFEMFHCIVGSFVPHDLAALEPTNSK